MSKWNGEERRKINVPLTKDEFASLDLDDKLWTILETHATQVQHCSGRFTIIEKKQSWFRLAIVVIFVCLAQWGVIKSDTILKFLLGGM